MAMASTFARRVAALVKKNLLLLVTRHWLTTLLQSAILPVLFLSLTLNIENFGPKPQNYGISPTAPIRTIAENISPSQYLVFVKPPDLGPDVDLAIKRISTGTSPHQILIFDDPFSAGQRCLGNFRGISDCFAIINFKDSPLTPLPVAPDREQSTEDPGLTPLPPDRHQIWDYSIRFDPVRYGRRQLNMRKMNNDLQVYYMSTQLTVDNTITNSTVVPNSFLFNNLSKESEEFWIRRWFQERIITTLVIAYFISTFPQVYQVVGFVTGERDDGVAQLIDAMGGSPAARVISGFIAFSAVQFVPWIVMGFRKFLLCSTSHV